MLLPASLHDCSPLTDPRLDQELAESLTGKVALVVGAGRGVGRECARFLVQASVKVVICVALEQQEVIDTAEECKQLNPNVQTRALAVDVRDYQAVETLVNDVEAQFGCIDVVLMNAGRPGQWLPLAESESYEWWDTVAVSMQGAFNVARAILPGMQKKKSGCLVFTSSTGAHLSAGMSGYVVAKLSQIRLAEIIHAENFAEYNIRCFAYHPGCVKTRFFTDFEAKALGKPVNNTNYAGGISSDEKSMKSAKLAFETLKGATFDSPRMAAGLVTALAAGKLDFMSGRYLDASVDIQHYIDHKDEIVAKDLFRVRLNMGDGDLIPILSS